MLLRVVVSSPYMSILSRQFAFRLKLCELGKPLFLDEITFWFIAGRFCGRFYRSRLGPQPVHGKVGCRANLRLGRPASGGRPLHAATAQRRDVEEDFCRLISSLLDFSHLFFTQKDVDALNAKYGTSLDDDVLLGNLKPAYEIYDLYQNASTSASPRSRSCSSSRWISRPTRRSSSVAKKRPGQKMRPKPISSGAAASRTNCCRKN